MIKWTAQDFKKNTGVDPMDDDLERVNCSTPGTVGHLMCGVCKHNKPMFMCSACFYIRKAEIAQEIEAKVK